MQSENSTLLLSIKDLLTPKMLQYSLLPFLVSVVVIYSLFFVLAGIGLDSFGSMDVASSSTTIENGVPHTDSFTATLQGTALIKFLMSSAMTSWIATFLVYTLGTLLALYFSIFIALLIIGFLTPVILKEIQQRHYQDVAMIGHSNILESLFLLVKWTLTMLLLFILFVPLYFIPLLGVVAFNLPLYYFFHKVITHDIASNICTKEEAMKIKFFHATALRLKTLALYLLALIPFVIFFASVFYVIYLGHSYFIETQKLRDEAAA